MKVEVKNMSSDKGNRVPNQFIIYTNGDYYFQSYQTIIAKVNKRTMYNDGIILDYEALNYSRTTSRYLYKFLGMDRKEIQRRIKGGWIKLKNLN
tara:strand:- start:1034 stop:1315 length:282 start_codon:yes stop_codon:yes gene_type:complete